MVLPLKGPPMDGEGILGAVDAILLFSSLSSAVSSLASLFSCSSHHVGLQPFMFLPFLLPTQAFYEFQNLRALEATVEDVKL